MGGKIEYIQTICGFEVTISVDQYDDTDMESIDPPDGFDFPIEDLFMAKPNSDPLSGKMISFQTYLVDKCVEKFFDEYGSYKGYNAEVEP